MIEFAQFLFQLRPELGWIFSLAGLYSMQIADEI